MLRNVLIVEDDPDLLEILQMMIEDNGCSCFCADEGEQAWKIFQDKKIERFLNLKYPIKDDITEYIRPLNKYKEQYGWYVYIDKIKADFGGVHISLEESKISAKEFIQNLKNHLAKHLDAGIP